jgi:predicted dehydrogenase
MIKVGLVGLGNMGSTHLRILSILKNVNISFIFDKDIKKMQYFSKQYNCPYVRSFSKELNKIDALIIASPTNTHYEYVKKSIKKVKYIFVEKPLSNHLAESKDIFNLKKKFNTNIQIGMIERYNPVFNTIKSIIKNEGKPIICKFNRSSNLSDRIKDTDVINDLMIHDIDLALNFNGPIDTIHSYGKRENKMIKHVHSTMQHSNGVLSIFEVSRITQKKIRTLSILFKNAYVEINLINKDIYVSKDLRINKENLKLKKSKDNSGYFFNTNELKIEVKPQEAALSQMNSFIERCLNKQKIKGNYYLEALEICRNVKKTIKLI